jgi:hypothetical protein
MTGPAFAEGFQGREVGRGDVGCVLREEGFVFEGFDGPAVVAGSERLGTVCGGGRT